MCPVCTIAVCAGLGLSRWLKVDDLFSGVWIGGLLLSALFWFIDRLKMRFKLSVKVEGLVVTVFYALTILPLFLTKIIGQPQNKICFFNKIYIDRLLFGIVTGTLFFLLGIGVNSYLKKKNGGKSYFPFQKVVLPISFALLATFILYLIK